MPWEEIVQMLGENPSLAAGALVTAGAAGIHFSGKAYGALRKDLENYAHLKDEDIKAWKRSWDPMEQMYARFIHEEDENTAYSPEVLESSGGEIPYSSDD